MSARLLIWPLFPALAMAQATPGPPFSPEGIQFFETAVRPTLHSQCSQCHNDRLRTSGLSVASRQGLLEGGNRGPAIAPGNPGGSLLLSAVRHAGALQMPAGGKLAETAVVAIERWIEIGAPWPEAAAEGRGRPARQHWAFEAISRPEPPRLAEGEWAESPIDRFVLARLRSAGLRPSPPASRETLIRRLYLDLAGVLPTPGEVSAFAEDGRPDAYQRLVERVLASPHYGERWGRHWLDMARYADSNGYNADGERQIWMYRDWVIDALNRDLPFDRFVVEQLAGDLLPNPSRQQLVATGFHRNTLLNLEGGVDFEQYRVESVVDRVDVTGIAFLGLSLGCARCHDHKFDPISQREFYEFFAFFNNIDELSGDFNNQEGRARAFEPVLEFGTEDQYRRRDAIRAQLEVMKREQAAYQESLLERQPEWESGLSPDQIAALPLGVRRILRTAPEERLTQRAGVLRNAFLAQDLGVQERRKAIAAVTALLPEIPRTLVMRELPVARPTHVLVQGDFLRKGEPVRPATPAVLPPMEIDNPTRLDLARWLVDRRNPLTPRVTVNRVWQRYFGAGIVATSNDFGSQGEAPSHPGLLDWLAADFVDSGWSMKRLHRRIVTSATYRQQSLHRDDLAEADPQNRLLGRQNRLRVESEIVRDLALSASGLLAGRIGGPSVFPAQPPGVMIRKPWPESKGANRYRRGMYTHFWRTSPHPGLMLFDSPDALTIATRRGRSTTPLQALTLLNDTGFHEFAQGLALRLRAETQGRDIADRATHAFRICLGRDPSAPELQGLVSLAAGQLDEFTTHPERAGKALTLSVPDDADRPELAAWTAVGSVLLNLDEFITRE